MFTIEHNLKFDPVHLQFLAIQTAGCVLVTCEERDVDDRASDRVAMVLDQYVNWADHGHTNALQSQVEFLYDYVKLIISERDAERPAHFSYGLGHFEVITAALQAYQDWKNRHIAAEKERYGDEWGDATGFNQKNWTDLNERFLQRQPV